MTDEERKQRRVDTALQETQALLDQGAVIRASMSAAKVRLHEVLTTIATTEIDLAAIIEDQSRRQKI